MEILAGILAFLKAVDLIFQIKSRINSAESRTEASVLLNHIADLIVAVADQLEQQQYPHDRCGEMHWVMTRLANTLLGKIPEEDLTALTKTFEECYQVERLFAELGTLNDTDKIKNINLLRSSAGSFRAAAALIKA